MENLRLVLREFVSERDWEQFHNPKNLAMALAIEAAELMEPFQWLSEEQSKVLSPKAKAAVEDELADVFIYLVRLSDVLGVDLMKEALRKIERNREKYPVEKVRGRAVKYTELD